LNEDEVHKRVEEVGFENLATVGNEVLVLVKSCGIDPDDCIAKHAKQIFDELLPVCKCKSICIVVILTWFVLATDRQVLL
jgi:hypothetical protein